jgi:hypothetical protein
MGSQLPLIDPNPPETTGDPDDAGDVGPMADWAREAPRGNPRALSKWPTDAELAALSRLVTIGHGHSGQCVYVRQFLLAWWNAGENGGFDLANLFCVDDQIAADMVTVFVMVASVMAYPDGCERLPDLRSDMEAFIDRAPKKRKRREPKPRSAASYAKHTRAKGGR